MKYLMFLTVIMCFAGCGYAKPVDTDTTLNAGFERVSGGKPIGWYLPDVPGYTIRLDSLVKHKGRNSICLSFTGDSASFTAVSLKLPHIYEGKMISLSGYIKTENVSGGRAGLWLRIDPRVAFDNMSGMKVDGTTDWKKYEIQLKMDPEHSKGIVMGGLLIGKGRMWLDDLEVKIDGKPLSQAPVFVGKQYPADKDTAFSKGSGITRMSTDKQTLENLKVLGLVWGYLKYYHPAVAKGQYNWSNQLFRLLPAVSTARTDAARDEILSSFITGLGPVKEERSKNNSTGDPAVKMDVDTSWIGSSSIGPKLAGQLRALFNAARPDLSYYYGFTGAGNVLFEHERDYPYVKADDIGMRLLALYRYWNAVEYFFPYRYLINDWRRTLSDYIPVMISADTRLKYELGLMSLITKIDDTHAGLYGGEQISHYFGDRSPAIGVAYIQDKWVVNRNVDSIKILPAGIKVGDVIQKVDNKPVEQIVQSRLDITSASNQSTRYRNISWNLLDTPEDSTTLTINRDGIIKKVTAKTFNKRILSIVRFADKSQPSFEKLPADIGYIYPGTMANGDVDSIMQMAAGTKGLVIDLRCYPSEFVVFTLGAQLTRKPVDFVKFSSIDHRTPGKIIMSKAIHLGGNNPNAYKGRVVVLVNEYTVSQAEYTTMAFRATGATVIGSTTAGADGNVSRLILPGNLSTAFSGLGVYYPDGTETQQVGIVPDIYCTPTIKGIREGKDEVLERAIRYIQTGK